MSLANELKDWKRKKAEAEAEVMKHYDNPSFKSPAIKKVDSYQQQITRIENVLKANPHLDDMEVEDLRHFEAVKSIMAKWVGKKHPSVA